MRTTPTVIKKYANRRLYHTGTSAYVTLDDLAEMVRAGEEFVVQDAKTSEDITRGVLGQIIFDAESRGDGLLPIAFMRQLIKFYGGQMQALVPTYLDHAIAALAKDQERLGKQMNQAFSKDAFDAVGDQVRRNMELFEKSMRVFLPFKTEGASHSGSDAGQPRNEDAIAQDVAALRLEMRAMQARLDALTSAPETPPAEPVENARVDEGEDGDAEDEPPAKLPAAGQQ